MKKKLFLLVLVIVSQLSKAQNVFNKIFDDSLTHDAFSAVCQALDGGYLLGGAVYTPSLGTENLLLIKVNNIGDTVWQKIYSVSPPHGIDRAYSATQLPDSNFILCTTNFDTTDQQANAGLLKIDKNGNIIWFHEYGDTLQEIGYEAILTPDYGYLLCGWTYSYTNGMSDGYAVKTDSSGTVEWEKHFGGSQYDYFYSVTTTIDGGFLFGGTTSSYGFPGRAWLLKTNSFGDSLWQKGYPAGYGSGFGSITKTSDGGFAISGDMAQNASGDDVDAFVVKVNSTGALQWSRTYGTSQNQEFQGYGIFETSDNSLVCGGSIAYIDSSWTSTLKVDGWIMKLNNNNGDTIWNRTYYNKKNKEHYVEGMAASNDGGYLLCGYLLSNGIYLNDAWVVKVDSMGCDNFSSCFVGIPNEINNLTSEIIVYPNPTSGKFTIESNTEIETVAIYNVLGEKIFSTATFPSEIDICKQPSGIYLLRLFSNEGTFVMKIVKE